MTASTKTPTIRFERTALRVKWSCTCGAGHRNSSEGCAITDAETHADTAHPGGCITELGGLW